MYVIIRTTVFFSCAEKYSFSFFAGTVGSDYTVIYCAHYIYKQTILLLALLHNNNDKESNL